MTKDVLSARIMSGLIALMETTKKGALSARGQNYIKIKFRPLWACDHCQRAPTVPFLAEALLHPHPHKVPSINDKSYL